jgi:hypothetical protein
VRELHVLYPTTIVFQSDGTSNARQLCKVYRGNGFLQSTFHCWTGKHMYKTVCTCNRSFAVGLSGRCTVEMPCRASMCLVKSATGRLYTQHKIIYLLGFISMDFELYLEILSEILWPHFQFPFRSGRYRKLFSSLRNF